MVVLNKTNTTDLSQYVDRCIDMLSTCELHMDHPTSERTLWRLPLTAHPNLGSPQPGFSRKCEWISTVEQFGVLILRCAASGSLQRVLSALRKNWVNPYACSALLVPAQLVTGVVRPAFRSPRSSATAELYY